MPLRPNEHLLIGQDAKDAARLAADVFVAALAGSGASGSVALAGGSTPAPLYATLAASPYCGRLPCRAIHWFWGDERAVPPDHPDSNYRMAMKTLLLPLDVPPGLIHAMPADRPDLKKAAAEYEDTIRGIVPPGSAGVPVLDLAILGVGSDGHTASLFPGSAALEEARRLVVPNYAPSQNAWRMTMTYPLLKAARHILFFITGSAKAETVARILHDAGPELPAGRLRDAAGQISWVFDVEAARLVARPAPE